MHRLQSAGVRGDRTVSPRCECLIPGRIIHYQDNGRDDGHRAPEQGGQAQTFRATVTDRRYNVRVPAVVQALWVEEEICSGHSLGT